MKTSYSFLTFGKTKDSAEGGEFKRYIGLAASSVLAINPTNKKLDELMGYESQKDPEYIGSDDNGKWARVYLIVRTDPKQCNGIEATNRIMFTIRNTPAYNRDQTKVQVIDDYGDARYIPVEDAKEGKPVYNNDGSPARFGKYRIAKVGEAELTHFLRAYLNVDDAFNYNNGVWTLKDDPSGGVFRLDNIENYLKGDFSELNDALKLQPNNKVKLLYGVRTVTNDEGITKQYQDILTRDGFVLKGNAGSKAITKLEQNLAKAKNNGSFPNTEVRVQELAEYNVEPTDLSQQQNNSDPLDSDSSSDMPWDN